jgi:hypothetical protein
MKIIFLLSFFETFASDRTPISLIFFHLKLEEKKISTHPTAQQSALFSYSVFPPAHSKG